MASVLMNLIDVLALPTEVFTQLNRRPRWFVPFVLLSAVYVIVGWFMLPFSIHLEYNMLSARLGPGAAKQVISISERVGDIDLFFKPALLLLKWALFAAILYSLCILLDAAPPLRFRLFFSVIAFSEAIPGFMSVVNILVLYAKGISSVRNVTDLKAIIGLDFFMKNKMSNLPLFILLNNINVFTIWYVATLAIGISVITGFRKIKSALIVTGVWLLGIAFQMVISAISSGSPFHPMN
ncbi:MAG: hypothetical protein M1339_03860 [Bacteroidetes bacterium]|nr:hypothetical protein [Bacteroidota bacterium]